MRWVDPEWPPTLQRSVCRLWEMYEESNNLRIDEKLKHAKFVKDLTDEKRKVDKKYNGLVGAMDQWREDTKKKLQEDEVQTMKRQAIESHLAQKMKTLLSEMQNERDLLRNEVSQLKEKMDKDQQDWEMEKRGLKEEKKKLEYALYDVVKANGANKDKLKRIKSMCEE